MKYVPKDPKWDPVHIDECSADRLFYIPHLKKWVSGRIVSTPTPEQILSFQEYIYSPEDEDGDE